MEENKYFELFDLEGVAFGIGEEELKVREEELTAGNTGDPSRINYLFENKSEEMLRDKEFVKLLDEFKLAHVDRILQGDVNTKFVNPKDMSNAVLLKVTGRDSNGEVVYYQTHSAYGIEGEYNNGRRVVYTRPRDVSTEIVGGKLIIHYGPFDIEQDVVPTYVDENGKTKIPEFSVEKTKPSGPLLEDWISAYEEYTKLPSKHSRLWTSADGLRKTIELLINKCYPKNEDFRKEWNREYSKNTLVLNEVWGFEEDDDSYNINYFEDPDRADGPENRLPIECIQAGHGIPLVDVVPPEIYGATTDREGGLFKIGLPGFLQRNYIQPTEDGQTSEEKHETLVTTGGMKNYMKDSKEERDRYPREYEVVRLQHAIQNKLLEYFEEIKRWNNIWDGTTELTPIHFLWYPPGGYMGWHANNNSRASFETDYKLRNMKQEGNRVYLVWCDEDNKSFFRYRNPATGEIVTKWEKKGWNINYFELIDTKNYFNVNDALWHCVYSECNRISFAFKVGGEI